MVSNHEILSWVAADGVADVLSYQADGGEIDAFLQLLQQDRAELVRTAIGVRLLEERELINLQLSRLGYDQKASLITQGHTQSIPEVQQPIVYKDTRRTFPPFSLLLYGVVAYDRSKTDIEANQRLRSNIKALLGGNISDHLVSTLVRSLSCQRFYKDNRHFEFHPGKGVSFVNPHMKAADIEGRQGRGQHKLRHTTADAVITLAHRATETVTLHT